MTTPASTFVHHQELVELTEFKRADKQAGWLREHGIPFEVGGVTGRPKVLRSVLVKKLGGQVVGPGSTPVGPDIISFQEALKKRRGEA